MPIYRSTWDGPVAGWSYRLDIMPYDTNLSASTTTLPAGAIISVGPHEFGFDEVPVGLAGPHSLNVKLNFSVLPSSLQTYLRNKVSGDARNTFLFFTNRGSGSTYTLEFCGVQAQIASAVYVTEPSGDVSVEYDLVDGLYHSAVTLTGSDCFYQNGAVAPSDTTNRRFVFDVGFPSTSYGDVYSEVDVAGIASHVQVTTMADAMNNILRGTVTDRLVTRVTRTANATADAVDYAFDPDQAWQNVANIACTFYKAAESITRTTGATLTSSSILLASHVYNGSTWTGGLFHPQDKYGWAQAGSTWDVMKDLCETFAAKATYYPVYNAGGGSPYISWTWNIQQMRKQSGGTATLDLGDALNFPDVGEGEASIGKAEVRYETENGDKLDKTEIVEQTLSRSDRSFNVEPIMHNNPVTKLAARRAKDGPGITDFYTLGFYHTNTILYLASDGALTKAHETTRVYYGPDVSDYIEASTAVSQTVEGLADEYTAASEKALLGVHQAWCNEVQANAGLPKALATFYRTVLGAEFVVNYEAEWPITQGSEVLPASLGRVHNVTGTLPTALSHLPFDLSVATSVSCDWQTGKSMVQYLGLP